MLNDNFSNIDEKYQIGKKTNGKNVSWRYMAGL